MVYSYFMTGKRLLQLAGFILLIELIGNLGTFATVSAIPSWYATLVKPPFNPPSWIFGPVWTVLFLLMGISVFLVYEKGLKKKGVRRGLWLFATQMMANIAWTFIFFGAKAPLVAFMEILVLWVLIFATIKSFYKISQPAAYLLYPYLAWVSFATLLNLFIVLLN